jgi:hypothetical protein
VSTRVDASCHCGNIRATFESAGEVAVRECQCSFCRAHASRTVADPQGTLTIRIADERKLSRYRFGRLRLADMLVCRECGVYVAAVMEGGDKAFGILNLRAAGQTPLLSLEVTQVDYDAETEEERRTRRERAWTPATLHFASP